MAVLCAAALALLVPGALRDTRPRAVHMDGGDHHALDVLRDLQPPTVHKKSAILSSWKHPAPPCGWPGVTCDPSTPASAFGRRLVGLDVRYSGLTLLPDDALYAWSALKVLELRGNHIARLPQAVGRMVALERLMLEMNELTELPTELFGLKNLTHLYLSHNRLTSLPPEIGNLPNLQDIWLKGNVLGTLPDSFCELTTLDDGPYLMDSGLTSLPDCFGKLSRVESLQLADNLLTSLPDSIQAMPKLQQVYLRNNQLRTLPAWLNGSMTTVEGIDVARNQITSLPPALLSLPPNLNSLQLFGNPLTEAVHWRLLDLLGTAPSLTALSLSAQNGSSASPADASQYLLTMPGIQEGFASCTSRPDLAISEPPARSAVPLEQPLQEQLQRGASACPFSIQTYTPSAGGLDMHYCLNTTDGCELIPLQDNHDGTYSGALDGRQVGHRRRATFRFYRGTPSHKAELLEEVVVGRWSDGSSCPDRNCFQSVLFEADCSAHGPFAVVVNTDETTRCACSDQTAQVTAPNGRWQCERVRQPTDGQPTDEISYETLASVVGVCLVVSLVIVFAYVVWPDGDRADDGQGTEMTSTLAEDATAARLSVTVCKKTKIKAQAGKFAPVPKYFARRNAEDQAVDYKEALEIGAEVLLVSREGLPNVPNVQSVGKKGEEWVEVELLPEAAPADALPGSKPIAGWVPRDALTLDEEPQPETEPVLEPEPVLDMSVDVVAASGTGGGGGVGEALLGSE